jgi:hypothetical protein
MSRGALQPAQPGSRKRDQRPHTGAMAGLNTPPLQGFKGTIAHDPWAQDHLASQKRFVRLVPNKAQWVSRSCNKALRSHGEYLGWFNPTRKPCSYHHLEGCTLLASPGKLSNLSLREQPWCRQRIPPKPQAHRTLWDHHFTCCPLWLAPRILSNLVFGTDTHLVLSRFLSVRNECQRSGRAPLQ